MRISCLVNAFIKCQSKQFEGRLCYIKDFRETSVAVKKKNGSHEYPYFDICITIR